MNNSFFYIFVIVVAIAIGYVVYAMYSMPKLGQNSSVKYTTEQSLFLS